MLKSCKWQDSNPGTKSGLGSIVTRLDDLLVFKWILKPIETIFNPKLPKMFGPFLNGCPNLSFFLLVKSILSYFLSTLGNFLLKPTGNTAWQQPLCATVLLVQSILFIEKSDWKVFVCHNKSFRVSFLGIWQKAVCLPTRADPARSRYEWPSWSRNQLNINCILSNFVPYQCDQMLE